ncbi:[Fe-Fe] hydrogenase large subunit C-terminal domain-containing protein [Acetivibrio saccincola]|uniref:Ferredoxin n=1 Tax=Acetivibrio saccincola TaxID=1677857 RepID=A0A2S8R9W1_9FIRM|nr:[Fe-Fe] hydrogenase large subunit C-terminal domain-containing protein [Acetivibrio saccincola]PQQ66593.1 ferredoxin [Acetivibrio saccincola]
MIKYFHSVTLDENKCMGCTNCIKRCPTEAIRVREGKARIINERCIDCGECIRVCPYHAKKAITDSFDDLNKFKYKVAIPAPTLYGQFKSIKSRNHLLTALKKCGFDHVFEVARAAEIITLETKRLIKELNHKKPMISSACPAVVRLIQVRFPSLIDNILKLESPMELAAKMVKDEVSKSEGIPIEDIGVFFITPCAAKVTSIKAPYEKEKSSVDGALSIEDMYKKILTNLNELEEAEDLEKAGFVGIRWANSGGESIALGTDNFLAVDGIHNVITILEQLEDDKLEDVDFVETLACQGGCIGGPLTVENLYVAKTRLKKVIDEAKSKGFNANYEEKYDYDLVWKGDVEYRPVMKLDTDFAVAMRKLEKLEKIEKGLPGLDCGACGAPTCRALAEDIVRGYANETDCIFKLREKIRDLKNRMMDLGG